MTLPLRIVSGEIVCSTASMLFGARRSKTDRNGVMYSSPAVEGELSEDGLATFGDDGDDPVSGTR